MTTSGGRIDGTRQAIVQILRRRGGGVSVDDLAGELGLAGATVRRHLDVLLRDDFVSIAQERGRAGRPRYLFSLTEAGEALFPQHYVRLTHRLMEEIVGLDPRETALRSGTEIADLVFEKMSERIAREYGPRIIGETLEERARSTAGLIADEGMEFEVDASGPQVRLLGRGCPCLRLGAHPPAGRDSCDHDRRMLEEVLGDVQVEPIARADLPSGFVCGYRLTPKNEADSSKMDEADREIVYSGGSDR